VRVKPGAKSTFVSINHGQVNVSVTAQAREGKANAACRKALAKALDLRASAFTLIRGEHSRVKIFRLTGIAPAELAVKLARLPP
jgi:uncharacterized protein YggU (UPF0235/DUF167 family)